MLACQELNRLERRNVNNNVKNLGHVRLEGSSLLLWHPAVSHIPLNAPRTGRRRHVTSTHTVAKPLLEVCSVPSKQRTPIEDILVC